jgi:predicted nuclease of predicted toxin-antitoxin system
MQILADTNVPEEYVSALRGDGHEVVYSREVPQLGPEATDNAITEFAEAEDYAILSTDISDFGGRNATVSILVAPQDMSGGNVRAAVSRLETLAFDPADTDPIWLSGL